TRRISPSGNRACCRGDDHGAGRIGFQLTRVEFITQSDTRDAGNHGIDSILWVLVRHPLRAVGRFDPDCVRAGLRGLTHYDGQPDGRWERREWFPIDIFGQDGFENLLPELVRPDFALLSTLYGSGFLRHTNLLRTDAFSTKENPPSCARKHSHQRLMSVMTAGIRTITTTDWLPNAGIAPSSDRTAPGQM